MTCPRCGTEANHSPDDKECSDHCITHYRTAVAPLVEAVYNWEKAATRDSIRRNLDAVRVEAIKLGRALR